MSDEQAAWTQRLCHYKSMLELPDTASVTEVIEKFKEFQKDKTRNGDPVASLDENGWSPLDGERPA